MIRSWYYFRTGYGTYVGFALGIFSFATTTYYLAIQSAPVIKQFFPGFIEFFVILGITLYPMAVFIGWLHLKGSPLFRAEQEIIAEANPYSNWRITPVMIPAMKLWAKQLRDNGLITDADLLDEYIVRSVNGK